MSSFSLAVVRNVSLVLPVVLVAVVPVNCVVTHAL